MRKLLLALFALMISTQIYAAKDVVTLTVGDIDDQPGGHTPPKSPIEPPTVYIEDYTLSFEAGHPDYALTIKDEDDNVVYSTTVWSAQTEVILPSTLSGEYEINLVMGNWLFTGWICLNIGDY